MGPLSLAHREPVGSLCRGLGMDTAGEGQNLLAGLLEARGCGGSEAGAVAAHTFCGRHGLLAE